MSMWHQEDQPTTVDVVVDGMKSRTLADHGALGCQQNAISY